MNRSGSWLVVASFIAIVAVVQVGRTWAQPSGAASSQKSGTRLITLGTRSGPTPTVGRAQSSNLLVSMVPNTSSIAGEGVTRRLTKLGTNFRNIDNIFHYAPAQRPHRRTGRVDGLVFDANRTSPVNIYGRPARWRASGD